jgi:hypothetical protein
VTVFYGTPWRTGDIGGGINEFVDALPSDSWVCIRDGDTLFLTPNWGYQVEQVIARYGRQFAVIGAMCNRLKSPFQLHEGRFSDEADIGKHRDIALERWQRYGAHVREVPGPLAGMCMIFNKRTWQQTPFVGRSIYFDKVFCGDVKRAGGRLGVAQGIYLFHLYRWGTANPFDSVEHLNHEDRNRDCHDARANG